MQPTLFYAWQSDADEKVNRYFIRDAAERALKSIAADGSIEDAPRLDHDTRDASGTPEIAGTIFAKIDTAGLLLADVTLVGKIESTDGRSKLTPNPNALIELGYAADVMGWDRIILVLNEHYGPPQELPFDLKHRRFPVTYTLAPGDEKATVRKALADELTVQIKLAMAAEHDLVERTISQLSVPAMEVMDSYFNYKVFKATLTQLRGAIVPETPPLQTSEDIGVERLLALGIIKLLWLPSTPDLLKTPGIHWEQEFTGQFGHCAIGYTWTYLGELVLKWVGLRPRGG
jgi:hypothetical protein